jgi:mono/diheme cytochrome c family protein
MGSGRSARNAHCLVALWVAGTIALWFPQGARADSNGELLYSTYCASCHGADGHGDGPVAKSLTSKPTDLTLLTKKYGVPLVPSKVAEAINGRLSVPSHGPREMPVWGRKLEEELAPGQPATEDTIRRTIDSIVNYLVLIQSIQGASR